MIFSGYVHAERGLRTNHDAGLAFLDDGRSFEYLADGEAVAVVDLGGAIPTGLLEIDASLALDDLASHLFGGLAQTQLR